jgi:hypothetical protein
MEKDDVKILSEGILEEIDEFIDKSKKIKKIIQLFIDNVDLLRENYSEEEITSLFSKIDIDISNLNSVLSIIFSDSKKLKSFLHEIKLLKRKRQQKLDDKESELNIDEYIKLLEKMNKPNTPNPYTPINPYPTYPPYSPTITPNTTPYNPPFWYFDDSTTGTI